MGMRLSPALFNRQLRQMGQTVSWRRAALCPCRNPDSGAARHDCLRCMGLGVRWRDPVPAWTGVAGQKVMRQFENFGRWEAGDVILTVPGASPLHAAGEHDRIQMEDSNEAFSVTLTRDGTDRLRGPEVISITSCEWERPGTDELVEGAPPAVAADGTLSWADPAAAPDPGAQYSLTGRRKTEYFVFQDLPQERAHFGGLPLPRLIKARRYSLFGAPLGMGQ